MASPGAKPDLALHDDVHSVAPAAQPTGHVVQRPLPLLVVEERRPHEPVDQREIHLDYFHPLNANHMYRAWSMSTPRGPSQIEYVSIGVHLPISAAGCPATTAGTARRRARAAQERCRASQHPDRHEPGDHRHVQRAEHGAEKDNRVVHLDHPQLCRKSMTHGYVAASHSLTSHGSSGMYQNMSPISASPLGLRAAAGQPEPAWRVLSQPDLPLAWYRYKEDRVVHR